MVYASIIILKKTQFYLLWLAGYLINCFPSKHTYINTTQTNDLTFADILTFWQILIHTKLQVWDSINYVQFQFHY